MKKKIMSKKTVKKITLATKRAAKKTESFARKAHTEVGKTATAIRKEWKREKPQRDEQIKNFRKVGGDVVETIKKDMKEIRNDTTKGKKK